MDYLMIVNKNYLFDEKVLDEMELCEYENFNEDSFFVEYETLRHFEMLKTYLKMQGILIDIDSAYRSLEKQENIFTEFMRKYGLDYAEQIVAMPGTSEHHTGLAIDITLKVNGEWLEENEDLLKQKEVFSIIHECLNRFGFILRYPEGKEDITGYPYEPWHLRYVGKANAELIGDRTLEEFLQMGDMENDIKRAKSKR